MRLRLGRAIPMAVILVMAFGPACGGGSDSTTTTTDIQSGAPEAGGRFDLTTTTLPKGNAAEIQRRTTTAPTTATTAAASAGGDVGPTHFSSPTRNIGCYLTAEEGRCDIREYDWDEPEKPADCELDWGGAVVITRSGPSLICHGDTVLGSDRVLAYGSIARRGPIECSSASTGMTCRHRGTGHGFTIKRSEYRFF